MLSAAGQPRPVASFGISGFVADYGWHGGDRRLKLEF
jgi:hypothetical protein